MTKYFDWINVVLPLKCYSKSGPDNPMNLQHFTELPSNSDWRLKRLCWGVSYCAVKHCCLAYLTHCQTSYSIMPPILLFLHFWILQISGVILHTQEDTLDPPTPRRPYEAASHTPTAILRWDATTGTGQPHLGTNPGSTVPPRVSEHTIRGKHDPPQNSQHPRGVQNSDITLTCLIGFSLLWFSFAVVVFSIT